MECTLRNPVARRAVAATLALLALSGSLFGGEADPAYFEKRIDLDLWGRHLGDAVSQITERSGIDLRVSPRFIRPKQFPRYKLHLEGKQMPARLAIEWLARSLGCRYRIDGKHSAWLTTSYDWMKESTKILIEDIESLLDRQGRIKAFEADVEELVKVHALFERYYIRIERQDQGVTKIVASLPRTLRQRLLKGLIAMSRPGQPLRLPEPIQYTSAETALLRKLRNQVVGPYRNQPARAVIRDISLQSNIHIALDPSLFTGKKLPRVTIALGTASARQFIEALAQQLGLKGMELYPPSGVWLTRPARKWIQASSREFLWENLPLKSYATGALAQAFGGGEVLAHHIRRRVSPATWLDPATAVTYHERSGNLIVVAPGRTQKAVLTELVGLQNRRQKSNAAAGSSAGHSARPH